MKRNVDEYFADLADRSTETLGKWWVTVIAILCLFAWIALGPAMHWSDTWQLIANTPTTWAELFIGFLTLCAANRVERRNRELLEFIRRLVQAEEGELKAIIQVLRERQP